MLRSLPTRTTCRCPNPDAPDVCGPGRQKRRLRLPDPHHGCTAPGSAAFFAPGKGEGSPGFRAAGLGMAGGRGGGGSVRDGRGRGSPGRGDPGRPLPSPTSGLPGVRGRPDPRDWLPGIWFWERPSGAITPTPGNSRRARIRLVPGPCLASAARWRRRGSPRSPAVWSAPAASSTRDVTGGSLAGLPRPVLDLETVALAEMAAAQGLAFLSLRAITDAVAEEIPGFLHAAGDQGGERGGSGRPRVAGGGLQAPGGPPSPLAPEPPRRPGVGQGLDGPVALIAGCRGPA